MRPSLLFSQAILTLSATLAFALPPLPSKLTGAFPDNKPANSQRLPLVIDTFIHQEHNDLGFWHGPSRDLATQYGHGYVRLSPSDPDQNFNTQFGPGTCFDIRPYQNMYLHIIFSGSIKFSVSLNQHNSLCDARRSPFIETWDAVEAARYTRGNDIYIPLTHFQIDQTRMVSVSFHGFFSNETLTLHKVEIVPDLPPGFYVPPRVDNGRVHFHCTRPNSFAFGIDDGRPDLLPDIMKILDEEDILVTFFVVGAGLRDKQANLSQAYEEMLQRGHQIALHSDTHRKMESLEITDINNEIVNSMQTFRNVLGIESRYFRPPYGTVGARTRQHLAAYIKDPQIINWSVDVEDYLWVGTSTPERQREAFYRDVGRGGNLVVMHYMDPTTVQYFREFVRDIKSINFDIMRVDQCLEDPSSPPLKPRTNSPGKPGKTM